MSYCVIWIITASVGVVCADERIGSNGGALLVVAMGGLGS